MNVKNFKSPEVESFYPWECLTLIRGMFGTSFDVVIRDMHHLLCLIHVAHRYLYQDFATQSKTMPMIRRGTLTPVEFCPMKEITVVPDFMLVYKRMKFKMKLTYESYMKNIRTGRLLNFAIYKTIIQRQCMAANFLSSFLDKEYKIQNGLFLQNEESKKEFNHLKKKQLIAKHISILSSLFGYQSSSSVSKLI